MIDRSKPLTEQPANELRALIDGLHANRERYDRANRIVEARSCELEIAEATRALAIVNRRATEAEDQRASHGIPQMDVDAALALLRLRDLPEAHALVTDMWTALQAMHPLTADEVRAVVRGAAADRLAQTSLAALSPELFGEVVRDIAARVAEKLAGRAVAQADRKPLTAREIHGLVADEFEVAVTTRGFRGALGVSHAEIRDSIAGHVAQRLVGGWIDVGLREADLREAFIAGVRWGEGFSSAAARRHAKGCTEDAAAEYARSKAGG